MSDGDSFGTTLALVGSSDRQVILIDGASPGSEETLVVLGGRGVPVVVLTADDVSGATAAVQSALEGDGPSLPIVNETTCYLTC